MQAGLAPRHRADFVALDLQSPALLGVPAGHLLDALVFSSGMTAICTLMMAYCGQGDVIVHSGPLYAASEGFVRRENLALLLFGDTPTELLDTLDAWRPPPGPRPWLEPSQT